PCFHALVSCRRRPAISAKRTTPPPPRVHRHRITARLSAAQVDRDHGCAGTGTLTARTAVTFARSASRRRNEMRVHHEIVRARSPLLERAGHQYKLVCDGTVGRPSWT